MTMETLKNSPVCLKALDSNKVLLGLSGGVDSTTAALLLKEKGFEVIGYYFDITGCNEKGREEAQAVADQVGIPLIMEDVQSIFDSVVIENFCSEYMAGRTPNPCIVCNPGVKFRCLLDKANEVGAFYIATGHYARIHHDELQEKYYAKQAKNVRKDQSYMLYRLNQEFLSRLIFPLGEFDDKEQIRQIARSVNLSNAEKKDSQEICFVPDDDYVAFMGLRGCSSDPGNFVNAEGRVLGKHKGIIHYTVGQRKGLGIALGKPAFVTKINAANNQVVLGSNDDLFSCKVSADDIIVSSGADCSSLDGLSVMAKVRYSAKPAQARLSVLPNGHVMTVFTEPQRAATPGQSVVWYDGDHVIGGGFIE